MNVSKPWLIVVILAAVAASFWFWDDNPDEQETVTDQTVPERSTYRPIQPSRYTNTLRDRTAPEWEGRDYRSPPESQYGMPYGAFTPPAGGIPGSLPQAGGYSFRPQEGKAETEPKRQAPSYRTTPPRQNYSTPEAIIGRNDLERSYQPQGPIGTRYQFRPQDSAGRSQRWTGNYYPMPGSAPLTPMSRDKPQPAKQYPSPWQQSGPKTGNNPLWADTRVPP